MVAVTTLLLSFGKECFRILPIFLVIMSLAFVLKVYDLVISQVLSLVPYQPDISLQVQDIIFLKTP